MNTMDRMGARTGRTRTVCILAVVGLGLLLVAGLSIRREYAATHVNEGQLVRSEMDRHLRSLEVMAEAIGLRSVEGALEAPFWDLLQDRYGAMSQLRGIVELGYAPWTFEAGALVSAQVTMRSARWGECSLGENLLDSPDEKWIRKALDEGTPVAGDFGIIKDMAFGIQRRGCRLYIPVNEWRGQTQEWSLSRDQPILKPVGILYATINFDPLVKRLSEEVYSLPYSQIHQRSGNNEWVQVAGHHKTLKGITRIHNEHVGENTGFYQYGLNWCGREWNIQMSRPAFTNWLARHVRLGEWNRWILPWAVIVACLGFAFTIWNQSRNLNSPLDKNSFPSIPVKIVILPILLFVTGILITFSIHQRENQILQSELNRRFEEKCFQLWDQVESRLESYQNALSRLQLFLSTKQGIPEDEWIFEWREQMDRFSLSVERVGIIEVGFGRIKEMGSADTIRSAEVLCEVKLVSKLGNDNAHQPFSLNIHEGLQSIALQTSEKGLRARASSLLMIPWIGQPSPIPAFRLFNTLNETPMPPEPPGTASGNRNESRGKAWGFIFATINMDLLMSTILGPRSQDIELEIFLGENPTIERRITQKVSDSGKANVYIRNYAARTPDSLELEISKSQYLQPWVLRFYSTRHFNEFSTQTSSRYIIWIGSFFSAILATLFGFHSLATHQTKLLNNQLQFSNQSLKQTLEERENISRHIHDQSLQHLFAISMGLTRLKKHMSLPDKSDTSSILDDSIIDISKIYNDLRRIAWGRNSILSPTENFAYIQYWVNKLGLYYGVETSTQFIPEGLGGERHLSNKDMTILSAFVTEAISNAAIHGKATNIVTRIEKSDSLLSVTIRDNGHGFNKDELNNNSLHRGDGINNLTRTAQLYGGHFKIDTQPGGGATVELSIPWPIQNQDS